MKIIETIHETMVCVKAWKKQGYSIGLVPTMGYLHDGHKSLIEKAEKENDKVVVSIFVNPIQFGPSEDLNSYPRDLQRDASICADAGTSLLFHPSVSEMYQTSFCTFVDMTGVTENLCGKSRPGHFRGVCTVVCKLLHIVQPHKAYFGQKDAQQLAVIRQMVQDLNIDVAIVGCPIVREADGLAMSSRNTYMNAEERKAALCLYHSVQMGQRMMKDGEKNTQVIENRLQKLIEAEPLAKIDYVKIVDAQTVQPVKTIDRTVLCAMAVYIGKTRLIDNFIFQL